MKKYFDLTTWILLFALAPFTILVLLSQNTLPGDLFYPVKRGMEGIVLAAASVNPSTKVAFRTDLTQRRFSEAEQLLTVKADPTAFSDFVNEVSYTQQDVSNISSPQEKIQAINNLITKLDQYQTQLAQVQAQVEIAQASNPQNNVAVQTTPTPIPVQPAPTSSPTQSIAPTQTLQPTSQPLQSAAPTTQPIPVTPASTIQPAAASAIANNPIIAEETKNTVIHTREQITEKINQLQQDKQDAQAQQKSQDNQQNQQIQGGEDKSGKNNR